MLKNLLVFVKYPSVSGIIASIWLASTALILLDKTLPVVEMLVINAVASVIIGIIGFRVERG